MCVFFFFFLCDVVFIKCIDSTCCFSPCRHFLLLVRPCSTTMMPVTRTVTTTTFPSSFLSFGSCRAEFYSNVQNSPHRQDHLKTIPHGLMARIRRSHRRGQGSIPCGGGDFFCLLCVCFFPSVLIVIEVFLKEWLLSWLCSSVNKPAHSVCTSSPMV